VHGVKVDLHLERLWSHNVTITTRLVDTVTTPMLLNTVQSKRIDAGRSANVLGRRRVSSRSGCTPSPRVVRCYSSMAMALSIWVCSGFRLASCLGRGRQSGHPVFEVQARHPVEVACVVGHQRQPFGQRVGSDLGVGLADGRAVAAVCVLQRAIAVGRSWRPRQRGQLQQEVVDQAATPVISGQAGLAEAQLGAGQHRDGHGLLQQALVHARFQPGRTAPRVAAGEVGVQQVLQAHRDQPASGSG
jgi:hypothetical protein